MKFHKIAVILTLCSLAFAAPFPGAETLREAAGNRLLVGCAVATRDLAEPKLAALVAEQFSCLTPEYEFMPEKLVDDTRKFTFATGDRVVAFAKAQHLSVFGHMLVWHFVTRKWLLQSPDGKPLPREEGAGEFEDLHRGGSRPLQGANQGVWDVVNEGISDKDGEFLKETPALRAIGADYIEKAFEFAHAVDPQAELYYNDYNIEQPGKLAKTIKLARSLQAKGVRLDAVGIQGHWLINWPSTKMIEKRIDAFAATGVKVLITEWDVDLLPRNGSGADLVQVEKGPNPYPHVLPPEQQEKLAKRYGEIVAALVRHPEVTMIGFRGTHDGRSWLNDYPVKGRTNHPLLFDRQYQPRPAFEAVIKALKARQTQQVPIAAMTDHAMQRTRPRRGGGYLLVPRSGALSGSC